MKSARESKKLARTLFRGCFDNGRFDRGKASRQLAALAAHPPRNCLAVLKELRRLIRVEEAKLDCRVESAAPLDDTSRAKITERVRALRGPDTTITFSVNPALLGGIRIRLGSDVWDGSIQGRLTQLRESFQKA